MLFYFYKSKLNIMESLSFNLCEKNVKLVLFIIINNIVI